jgi:hypothetical protein
VDVVPGALETVPFESERWTWERAEPTLTEHLGRTCVFVPDSMATMADVEFMDGVIEADFAVPPERGFHGVLWRAKDDENFESFFVRPHQVGNPDAVQYTPVFNGISAWQLYHGPGYWAPVAFPLEEWFRIRVVFAGERAEVYVGDMDDPALAIRELKCPVEPGRVGVFVGGPGIHLSGFAYDPTGSVEFRAPALPPVSTLDGVVPAWWISDAFAEEALAASAPFLDRGRLAARTWSRLASEASGLVNLARVNGLRAGKNTVFARTAIRSARAQTKRLELGFSDRAVLYLNGQALYRGDDTYRSRDYRFLGASAISMRSTFRLCRATTSWSSPFRRTSAAGGSRRGSQTSSISRSNDVERRASSRRQGATVARMDVAGYRQERAVGSSRAPRRPCPNYATEES